MAETAKRVRGAYGNPFARIAKRMNSPELLAQLGNCLVETLKHECKDYFAKRGWSGNDPMGGHPIWDSFAFQIRGKSTVEITSTFYGMAELSHGDIPDRRMTWLTQDAKKKHPADFKLTDTERKLGMKLTSKNRMPLIVPLKAKSGEVVLRMAPLTSANAWIHPGIAKFTFFESAVRKGRQRCAEMLKEDFVKTWNEDPLTIS